MDLPSEEGNLKADNRPRSPEKGATAMSSLKTAYKSHPWEEGQSPIKEVNTENRILPEEREEEN